MVSQHGLRVPRVYQHVSNMVCVSQGCTNTCPMVRSTLCTSTCPTWSACPKGVPARVQHGLQHAVYTLCPKDVPACVQHGLQHAVYTWIPREYQHVSNMVCSMLCIPVSQGCTSTCPTWSAACCVYLDPKGVPARVQHVQHGHVQQHAVYTWIPRVYQHVSNTCPTWSAACCVDIPVSNMVSQPVSQGCTSTCPTLTWSSGHVWKSPAKLTNLLETRTIYKIQEFCLSCCSSSTVKGQSRFLVDKFAHFILLL